MGNEVVDSDIRVSCTCGAERCADALCEHTLDWLMPPCSVNVCFSCMLFVHVIEFGMAVLSFREHSLLGNGAQCSFNAFLASLLPAISSFRISLLVESSLNLSGADRHLFSCT